MKRPTRWLARCWVRLRGWRTLAIFSPVALLSLLDALKVLDLTPLLDWAGVSVPSRGAITTAMAVLAILLRIYTTTPPGKASATDGGPR